jgi:putative GTP pyrophosphokinase
MNINRRILEKQYRERIHGYSEALISFEAEIKELLYRLPLHPTIKSRIKTFDSYYRKILNRLNKAEKVEAAHAINDLLGIRIICPFLEDLRAVEQSLTDNFQILQVEYKGDDHSVKEFGYESTHMLIELPDSIRLPLSLQDQLVCEIQLRTILQEAWAEIEHELVYKADFAPFDEPLRRKLASLNATLTLSDIIFQEIRDYQQQLQLQLRKRRETFASKVEEMISEITKNGSKREKTSSKVIVSVNGTGDNWSKSGYSCNREDIDTLLLQALSAHNARQFDQAITLYTDILKVNPQSFVQAIIYIHRGIAYFMKSDYDRALEDFSSALQKEPKNEKALYCRGVIHWIRKNSGEALSDLDRSLELNPYQFEALYSRAQLHYQLENYPAAIEDCERALSIDPSAKQVLSFLQLVTQIQNKKK